MRSVVGIVVGLGGFGSVLYTINLCKIDIIRGISSLLATLLGVGAIVLVALWATDNDTTGPEVNQFGFLGTPDWDSNIFAWHPVLLVAGFFFSQILALLSWSVFSDHSLAKKVHATLQTCALCTLVSGIWAIEEYKDKKTIPSPSFTSMHSWIGLGATVMFSVTYTFGLTMALLTQFFPQSRLRSILDLRAIHRRLGMISLILTTSAIVSGVVNQFGKHGCDSNSNGNYQSIHTSCKLANGMGLLVLASTGVSVMCIVFRDITRMDGNQHLHQAIPSTDHMHKSSSIVIGDTNHNDHCNRNGVTGVGEENWGIEIGQLDVIPSAPPLALAVHVNPSNEPSEEYCF